MVALAGADGDAALILSNAAVEEVSFVLPETGSDARWRLRLDSGDGRIDPKVKLLAPGAKVGVSGRSLQLYSL